MPNTPKPTQEELDATIKKAEELEKKADPVEDEFEEEDDAEDEDDSTDNSDDSSDDAEDDSTEEGDDDDEDENEDDTAEDDEEDDTEEDDNAEDDEEDKSDKTDKKDTEDKKVNYKKKFSDSTREAHVLRSKNKKVFDAIEEAEKMEPPTDEEMQKEYSDWESMSDVEKRIARDNEHNKKKFKLLNTVVEESRDVDAWNSKVDDFVDDAKTLTKYPKLDGRVEDFKIFALKPTRRGVDFEDLVAAFLYDVAESKPKKKKGKMFESGKSGKKEKKNNGKISIKEARRLMQTNYAKYKELLKADKIDYGV